MNSRLLNYARLGVARALSPHSDIENDDGFQSFWSLFYCQVMESGSFDMCDPPF